MEITVKHQIMGKDPNVFRQEFDAKLSLREKGEKFQLLQPVDSKELSASPQPRMN